MPNQLDKILAEGRPKRSDTKVGDEEFDQILRVGILAKLT